MACQQFNKLNLSAQNKHIQPVVGFISALLMAWFMVPSVSASDESEVYEGRRLYEEILSNQPAYNDPELQSYVNKIGQRLAAVSDRSNLQFTFTVMDDRNVNAYALPGGFIFINRGLMAYMNTEDQLAAALAHEIAHVTQRHAIKQKRAATTNKVLGNIASVVTYAYTGHTGLSELSDYLGQAWVSGYGRNMELESDSVGVDYMLRAGYDHKAMLELITILKHQETLNRRAYRDRNERPPSYHGLFSTHPKNDRRLREVISRDSALPKIFGQHDEVGDYLTQIDNLAYGPSTTLGFDAQNTYYSKPESISVDFPDDWQTSTSTKSGGVLGSLTENPKDAYIQMQIHTTEEPIVDPVDYAKKLVGGELAKITKLSMNGFTGIMAEVPINTGAFEKRRLAILLEPGATTFYVFLGAVTQESLHDDWLIAFGDTTASLTRLGEDAVIQAANTRIHIYTTQAGDSYESLMPPGTPKLALDQLRLINGDYPRKKLGPGQRIKLVRK